MTLKVVVAVEVPTVLKVATTLVIACTFTNVEVVAVVVARGLPLAVSIANSKPTFGVITKSTLLPCKVVVAEGVIIPLPVEVAITLKVGVEKDIIATNEATILVVACTLTKVEVVAVVVANAEPLAESEASLNPAFGVITKSTLLPCKVVVAKGVMVPFPVEVAVTANEDSGINANCTLMV